MYNGDRSRKETLVDYGFRLPSALDNRPLKFEEFERQMRQADLRLRHARGLRGEARRAGRGAGGAAHGARRSRGDRAPGEHAGRRPALGGEQARGGERAGARDHAHQAHGRGPHRLPRRARREGALPALRHRHRRARGDHPRPEEGPLRRAGGHQPAARGPRPAGGVAGGDPRRGQGGVPALGAARSSRPSGAPRATSTARRSSTPTR